MKSLNYVKNLIEIKKYIQSVQTIMKDNKQITMQIFNYKHISKINSDHFERSTTKSESEQTFIAIGAKVVASLRCMLSMLFNLKIKSTLIQIITKVIRITILTEVIVRIPS